MFDNPLTVPTGAPIVSLAVINDTLVSFSWTAVTEATVCIPMSHFNSAFLIICKSLHQFYSIQGSSFGSLTEIATTAALTLIADLQSMNIFIINALNSQGLLDTTLTVIASNEEILTLPPSNLTIIHVTNTTATLQWSVPRSVTRLSVSDNNVSSLVL